MSVLIPDPTYPGNLSWKELRLLRKQTAQFIAANQVNLSLMRREYVSDGAGGVEVDDEATISEQAFRHIQQAAGRFSLEKRTIDGETVTPSAVLLGKYDADMKAGDRYSLEPDKWYRIVFVREDRRYETQGEVVFDG